MITASKLREIVLTVTTLGFVAGVYAHQNYKCSSDADMKKDANDDREFSIFTYFIGAYFTVHLLTWFVVFSFLYQFTFKIGFHCLLSYVVESSGKVNFVGFFTELFYGYWTAGEILGGWCDLEQIKKCIDDNNSTDDACQSFFVKEVARFVLSICERLTSDYNANEDVYVRSSTSVCANLFRLSGHFLMTFLSTMFTIVLIWLL